MIDPNDVLLTRGERVLLDLAIRVNAIRNAAHAMGDQGLERKMTEVLVESGFVISGDTFSMPWTHPFDVEI